MRLLVMRRRIAGNITARIASTLTEVVPALLTPKRVWCVCLPGS
jgi:hypothetical protein